MENSQQIQPDPVPERADPSIDPRRRGGNRVWLAFALIVVGGAMFLRQMGVNLPEWLYSWQMLLIVIGIFMGFSHAFRGGAWLIPILVGLVFLLDDFIPGFSLHKFAWPAVIIVIGLLMLIRPRRPDLWSRRNQWEQKWRRHQRWHHRYENRFGPPGEGAAVQSAEDYFESISVFSGVNKVILSKNFSGGEITCFMGGCEIDLTQADFQTKAVIEITQVFGGSKLIVPSHWKISTQVTTLFGAIEDKREQPIATDSDKVLVIEGTSVFGGIEIRNFK